MASKKNEEILDMANLSPEELEKMANELLTENAEEKPKKRRAKSAKKAEEEAAPQKTNEERLNELIEKIVVHEATKDKDGKRIQKIEIYYRFVGKIDD